MTDDLERMRRNGKEIGLMQAQVIVLQAAQAYPNHRSVLQIVAEKIGVAAKSYAEEPQTLSNVEEK